MAKSTFPTHDEIIEYISENSGQVGKRQIARDFSIKGNDRKTLKAVLAELLKAGRIEKTSRKFYKIPGDVPETCAMVIRSIDKKGDIWAEPMVWAADAPPPRIFIASDNSLKPAPKAGEQLLVKTRRKGKNRFTGQIIRRMKAEPSTIVAVYHKDSERGGGHLQTTDKQLSHPYKVRATDTSGAEEGELVKAVLLTNRQDKRGHGRRLARITERLVKTNDPKALGWIAIHQQEIPYEFDNDVMRLAESAGPATMENRTDLRHLDFVTIDGETAKDFDDAVFAEPDTNENNPDGWHIIVAIADIAWYVRAGDALDKEAYKRGNSVYLPDRVIPMLPEALSNGWCSLKPLEDRGCMAVHIYVDAHGNKFAHKFERVMIKSKARLTYKQMQAAIDGAPDPVTEPVYNSAVKPLYGAYKALKTARDKRGVLNLEIPERKVLVDRHGEIESISLRETLESHKLIELMMVAANVCAAEELEKHKQPVMYRVHDEPSGERITNLHGFVRSLGQKVPSGKSFETDHFNAILSGCSNDGIRNVVTQVILRTQSQAVYSPNNIGHFGLNLQRYAHFTSPIRRYADLMVHRALITALGLGKGGLRPEDIASFDEIAQHISNTERRAMVAERNTTDRYIAAYLAEREGAKFSGRINGVSRFGIFVTLDETGADGLVPVRTMADDFYVHEEEKFRLVGRKTGRVFRLGDRVSVVLVEVTPVTGGLLLRLDDKNAQRK